MRQCGVILTLARSIRHRPDEPMTPRSFRRIAALLVALGTTLAIGPALAQDGGGGEYHRRPGPVQDTYSTEEIVQEGHRFFGVISRELASLVERAAQKWGRPNGYILGEEGSGAFIGGLRYGEGTLFMRTAGERKVYWQGPTVGFDLGAEGTRTMMLVYNLRGPRQLFQRFGGVSGSAYLVGGFGMTALTADDVILVPIHSGVGARLGLNIGYLKFTPSPTWNPF
jgi:hypothetical protein